MTTERTIEKQYVYDPRGLIEADFIPLSARPKTLLHSNLAVLDNTKWNAGKFLRKIMQKLNKQFSFANINYYRKESFSMVASLELLTEIVQNNDIAITAIGD